MAPRLRFLVKFVLIIAVSYVTIALRPVDRAFVAPFTRGVAAASAAVLRGLGQDVTTDGTILRSPSFAVDVKNGCNGLEALLLLIAAIAAYPASWKTRMAGILAGSVIIEGVNLIRVSSLFIIGRDYPRFFDSFHITIWQTVIFVLSIGLFTLWSSRFASQPRPADA